MASLTVTAAYFSISFRNFENNFVVYFYEKFWRAAQPLSLPYASFHGFSGPETPQTGPIDLSLARSIAKS
jgi:hypothetical protein